MKTRGVNMKLPLSSCSLLSALNLNLLLRFGREKYLPAKNTLPLWMASKNGGIYDSYKFLYGFVTNTASKLSTMTYWRGVVYEYVSHDQQTNKSHWNTIVIVSLWSTKYYCLMIMYSRQSYVSCLRFDLHEHNKYGHCSFKNHLNRFFTNCPTLYGLVHCMHVCNTDIMRGGLFVNKSTVSIAHKYLIIDRGIWNWLLVTNIKEENWIGIHSIENQVLITHLRSNNLRGKEGKKWANVLIQQSMLGVYCKLHGHEINNCSNANCCHCNWANIQWQ